MPAPQNRTHNTQLINNVRHKTHEIVYARKFIPTKILDYQFFEIPQNIITRNFLRIRYLQKQHYIIGLARTRKCNAFSKFMYTVCLQALMNVGYAHTI